MFRFSQEDNWVWLGFSESAANTQRTACVYAKTNRPVGVLGWSRPRECLAFIGYQGLFFFATFTLFRINWPYIDWQWRRYCDETDCRRYRENPTSSTKVLEPQNRPWLLGCKRSPLELFYQVVLSNYLLTNEKGQIHPLVRYIPTHLSNNAHWLLDQLRPTIFLNTKRFLQHASKNPHGSSRQPIFAWCKKARKTRTLLDC